MTQIETTGSDYEYRGMMARFWDALRGDTTHWEDQVLFRELALQGGASLDVGCGAGRLLLDLRAHGADIDGVDISPEMLALCRAGAAARGIEVTLYEQPMESLELPRRYRRIFVPSSSFQLLCDPADAHAALARFVAHLELGGSLWMPFMTFGGDEASWSEWFGPREATLPDGSLARRWSRYGFDPATSCSSTEDRYERLVDGQVVESELHRRAPATRSYTQEEVRALYESAGLVDVRMFRGFTREPAVPTDTTFMVTGARPG